MGIRFIPKLMFQPIKKWCEFQKVNIYLDLGQPEEEWEETDDSPEHVHDAAPGPGSGLHNLNWLNLCTDWNLP